MAFFSKVMRQRKGHNTGKKIVTAFFIFLFLEFCFDD